MAWTSYQKALIRDIEAEVRVKGPATVAEELEIPEECVGQLAPEESRKHDEAHANR